MQKTPRFTPEAINANQAFLDQLSKIAENKGGTLAQIALAWLLAQPAVASVIMGVRTVAQLEDNLRAIDLQLPEEEIARLSEASAPEEGYPYRFIRTYGDR